MSTQDKMVTDKTANTDTANTDRNIDIAFLVFAVLYVVMLLILAWAITQYSQAHDCETDPNISCYDDWYCQRKCTLEEKPADLDISPCYYDTNTESLVSCLYKPFNEACIGQGDTNDPNSMCYCDANANNCLNGCKVSGRPANENVCPPKSTSS